VEGHVVTGRHDQRSARLEERPDLLAKDLRLLFVGDEQEDGLAPGGSLRNAEDAEARAQGGLLVGVVAVADHDLGHAALAQVLGLCGSLVAVADDGEALALDNGQVSIAIVIDSYAHVHVSFPVTANYFSLPVNTL